MMAVVSLAVLQCSRSQKSGFGMRAICALSLILLIDFSSWYSLLKAGPQESPLAQPHANSKNGLSPQPAPKVLFFEKHAEGWHWYEDALKADKIEKKEEPTKGGKKEKRYDKRPFPPGHTPTEVIEAQRKALEQKLHLAIIEPSHENITSYLLAQKALMDQSQKFSEAWKKVVLSTPSLDETLIHPVDQNARHIYYDEKNKELESRIKALAKEYGLFFFFRENCPYCHHFAPIVKRFSQKYGWSVLGISLDGGTLPEFPQAKQDNGISKRLQIAHVPALIALHPRTGKLVPLAFGMISESEIEARVLLWSADLDAKSNVNLPAHLSEGTKGHGLELRGAIK